MAKLPEIQPRGAVTRGAVSSVSAAEVANPFQQIANALGDTADMLQKKNVDDANTAGESAVYRDADGNLKVDSRSNMSASGRAYNAAAQQGYAARLAGDIRTRGTAMSNEAKGNVDAFNSSWKAFRDQTLTAVPKEFRGAVTTMLDTEGPRFGLGVSEQKRTSDLKEFEGNIKSEIQLLDDDASTLARGGGVGTEAYKQKQAQIQTLYQQLADNPDFIVGKGEAEVALKRMEGRHMSEAMLGSVEKALNTGGIGEAKKISEAILTDSNLALTPAERRQYSGLANERINGFVAQTKANLKPIQDQSKTIRERLKEGVGLDSDDIDTTARTLAAGGDMSGALELYQARATARTLQTFRMADNPGQLNRAEGLFSSAAGGDGIIAAMQQVESSGDPNAESPKGASGHMQVMPGTGAEIAAELGDTGYPVNGTEDEQKAYLKSGDVSTRYGTHYFNKMMNRYGGDQQAALIAYNGGADRADKWLAAGRDDSVIPRESADYYKKVLGRVGSATTNFTPEEATAAKTFLQARTDKDASHIDGLDNTFAVKLAKLFEAAPAGIREKLGVYSGSRSNERQAELYAAAVQKYGSEAEARKWVAPPGKSQHNLGKAADVGYDGKSLKNAPPEVVKWVHDNAATFGLKFPLGNENWHIEDASTRGGKSGPQVNPEVVKEYRTEVTSDAKSMFTDIKAGYDKGMTPAVSDINLLSRQLAIVDDQDFRKEVADYFTTQSAVGAAAGIAPAQLESLISSLQADASDGATIAQQQIITGMQDAEKARAQALKDDPIGYGVRKGMIAAPPALDLANPDSWGPTFSSLQNGVDVMQARGEVGNISALRPEMQQQVARALSASTPQDSVKLLSSMAQHLDNNTYRATLGKLYASGETRSVAVAGALMQHNPQAAESILRGRQLMQEEPSLAPDGKGVTRGEIDKLLPATSFAVTSSAARADFIDAASAIYADMSFQTGKVGGAFSSERMRSAINAATGGLVDFNGSKVVPPKYGLSQDDFDAMISTINDADLADAITSDGRPVTAREVRGSGKLQAVSDGRYLINMGSAATPEYVIRSAPHLAKGRDGFILDLRGR